MSDQPTAKVQALAKLRVELGNDVSKIVQLARQCGFIELQLLAFELHKARLTGLYPQEAAPGEDPTFVRLTSNRDSDAIKYALQACVKYGDRSRLLQDAAGNLVVRRDLVTVLVGSTNVLNAKAETASMIGVFDVAQEGHGGRYLRVEVGASIARPEVKELLAYANRLEVDNTLRRRAKRFDELLDGFEQEYRPYADLFETEFGTPLATAVDVNRYLVEETARRVAAAETTFPRLANGNVDANDPMTALLYMRCCYVKAAGLAARFGETVRPFLARLTFDPAAFDEHELRYHTVTRTPLFQWADGELLVIGELVLDSLFTNTHYSLLENAGSTFSGRTSVAQEYKRRYADRFLDTLAAAAATAGYREVSPGTELTEGKRQLGDLDIVFVNDAGHYLIVEAKNHTLPLPVFFMDRDAIDARRKELRDDWEAKVLRREAHLRREHARYGIGGDFTYVIVSRQPEILSHASPLLVLSVQEFREWLTLHPGARSFAAVYQGVYGDAAELTPAQLQEMRSRGMIVLGDARPPRGGTGAVL